ncbi:hypothetical protein [Aureimonas pseudogalii]|uniref:Ankyrin repeat domain-containing protein n=1 Tax=Aureimonas pseudogalii TaxID=1744844 RepID=A0A7W6MKD5_9HYPH|nr:hypothetical protein [Aureimonas pseudogalii]MBB3998920.1 hypothetical protein [Aureimonas pseudogalii]
MTPTRPLRLLPLLAALLLGTTGPSLALSQITGEDGTTTTREGIVSVPLPPVPGQPAAPAGPGAAPSTPPPTGGATPAPPAGTPAAPPTAAQPQAPSTNTTAPPQGTNPGTAAPEADPDTGETVGQAPAADLPPADIAYGEDELPTPVRDLRRKLIEAARTGDVEKLRPLLETGAEPTALSASPGDEDPIEILKGASGDGNGVEMLAILLETLEAGHVRLGQDGDNEIFVWPYFTQVNLETLTKPQLVELFELVTAGDYQRMVANGSYDFFRVGISPEGRFEFFVAGD